MRHGAFDIETALPLPDGGPEETGANRPLPPEDPPRQTDRARLRALLGKQALPLGLTLIVVWLVGEKAAHLDMAAVGATIATLRPAQWVLALLATAGSFWAVGHYDRVLHAQLGTGIAAGAARRTGVIAIALSQVLGFGALTGTLVRWRMLPELTLWQAARLSAAVALSFLAGWAVVAALAVLIFRPDHPWMMPLATGAILLAGTLTALSVYPPGPLVRLPWPSLRTIATVVGLTALDTLCAALALYALLPQDLALAAGQVISAYLFSLGAGLVGATPGGFGPFEAAFAALLPSVDIETLIGAVLAFRLVYYLLPALLCGLLLLRGPRRCNLSRAPRLVKAPPSPRLPAEMERQLFAAPRAEANLLRTRDFSLLTARNGRPLGLVAPIGQSLVMLSDPLVARTCPSAARGALSGAAAQRYRMPAIYKCGARMAASARRAGWRVLPVAEEAWLVPGTFSLEGSNRRQLRRLLGKAAAAGLTVREAPHPLPLAEMDRVAAEWRGLRGRERGFSMGTYERAYVSCQRIFLAFLGPDLVGFVTLHETRSEMTLDLMRTGRAAPDGTVQALIVAAIGAAARQSCPRLSLAAVPWQGTDANPLLRRLRAIFLRRSGAAGLRRFKAAFDPRWETLYLAAPSRLALTIAAMDILRRVTAPPRRPTSNLMKASRLATHRPLRIFRRQPR
ncbi:phosphatidylglycerol lysyltransferase domain-containing protein [Celeribacter indicus]|uniref:Phosphatidylglycerol lysyltransferase C-terminal domain-containing protein n=1 Tax=Celeribacter indicus TaxID=1208324 RepID=A0A0B5DSD3_9RHOB|nr:phosphatidylglycerol lysyltransferase domain-containing protein [Celeribacter indicus]AJE46448.1 hypothetical protein P73_1733 [Celeribacter indicus]SDW56962.1 phosphatidylglycerol lysyltransferase [Celeribacter indicus]